MNEHRGDVEIKLGGRAYPLRPTYQALIEIENQTGQSLTALTRKAFAVGLTMAELAAIVTAGMRAGGEEKATAEKVGEMIFKDGVLGVTAPIAAFLTNALRGGRPPGEAEAAKSEE